MNELFTYATLLAHPTALTSEIVKHCLAQVWLV